MKLCLTCRKNKENIRFGRRSASVDGLSSKCKECQSLYDKKRANNPDRVKARLAYSKTKNGIDSRDRARKVWANNNKGKIYEITKSYRDRFPIKCKAHGKVAYAVKVGDLTPGRCESCGEPKTHGHHDDYSKALDVRWLCAACHSQWHKDNGEGLNPS